MIQLNQIKTPNLRYSERLLISEHYAVSLTSRRAVIMDRQFNLLHEIKNLDYVYNGEISSDEKWLLLVSNGNHFHLYSLKSFQLVTKQHLTGIYNFNLEGMGCFSFDGMNVLIPITNHQTLTSVLRMYEIDDFSKFRDYHLNDQYQIHSIQPIAKHSKYLMEAFDRASKKNALILFDGENYSAYRDNDKKILLHDILHDRMTYFEMLDTKVINREGELIVVHSDDNGNLSLEGTDQEVSLSMNKDLNRITAMCKSSYHPFYYLGTDAGLIIYDPSNNEILFKKKNRFGILEIQELRNDLISVVTFDQELLYEVIVE